MTINIDLYNEKQMEMGALAFQEKIDCKNVWVGLLHENMDVVGLRQRV